MNADLEFENILKNYIEENKKASQKRLTFFDEIIAKVKKGNKEGNDALKVIEKAYLDDLKAESDLLEDVKNQIAQIETELNSGLDTYYQTYNIDNETKKLQDAKEKGVAPKLQAYRKDLHDIKFRYDRLVAEEKDTLSAKDAAIEEFDNDYKQKLVELDKKKKYEKLKVENAKISATSEYQRQLSETNDKKTIKKLNQKIQEEDKKKLKAENEINLKYLTLSNETDNDYYSTRKELLFDRALTVRDYKNKKDELDTEKAISSYNYQIELDKYDFGSRRAITNLNKQMVENKNGLIASFKEKEKELAVNYKPQAIEKIGLRKVKSADYNNVMQENFKAIYETLNTSDVLISNNYQEEVTSIHGLFNEMLEYILLNISTLHQEYALKEIESEYDIIKMFISTKYNQEALVHRDYTDFTNKLQALYDDFKAKSTEKGHAFETKLNEIFDEFTAYINNTFKRIEDYWKEDDTRKEYHEKLNQLFNDCIKDNIQYQENEYAKQVADFPYVDEVVNDYNECIKQGEIENQNEASKTESEEKALDEEIENYKKAKETELENIKAELVEKKNNTTLDVEEQKKEFEAEANESLETVKYNFEKDKKEIETDYQTQMKLLK